MANLDLNSYSLPYQCYESNCIGSGSDKANQFHNVIEPLFDSQEYTEYMDAVPILKRISVGANMWAGDGVPNDAHFWGKNDILTDPQFQGDNEVNYFRKTNTDLVTFIQTEGWLCLIRIRKVLKLLNEIENYEENIEALSRNAGHPVDSWGTVFEKMHPPQCRCAPCYALREVRKQLEKRKITGKEITNSVIHHVRRCVYRVLTAGIDRIFETFCSRRFSVVWFLLSEEFEEHYRDTEFEKMCSLIINDIVAIEPLTSLSNFSKTLLELYDGATDLASAVLHKFAVILGSNKFHYTTSMNFIMFYIDSFNMIIRMLKWLENKFRVFNQLANGISDQTNKDKLDFKTLILHAMYELVYSVPDVLERRTTSLQVIGTYQKLQKSYFGPNVSSLKKYLDYIDKTLLAASAVFQNANLPCKCPTFKVPKNSVIDAALYINPYRDDQFDTPQVFHCYWHNRFIIERSQSPWKLLYNNKTKILLRLTIENPADKNKKLAVNVFVADENSSIDEKIKDQYFALYESRLDRLVDFFDVIRQEVIEYYANSNVTFKKADKLYSKRGRSSKADSVAGKTTYLRRTSRNPNKISLPTKLRRPDKRSRHSKNYRMAILSSLMQKHRKIQKPSIIESLEQLLTFAVKTGVEGSGMLSGFSGEPKDVYVSITCVDRERRAKADQEFSLHELMSFIIFWYAKHGCLTEFEGHSLHRRKYENVNSKFTVSVEVSRNRNIEKEQNTKSLKDKFPLLYKAAEELDSAECYLTEQKLAILNKEAGISEEDFKRCRKGIETTIFMNDGGGVQSKRAFTKLASSGFCVTQRGEIVFAEGGDIVTTEVEAKKLETVQKKRRSADMTKVPEIMNRMRKTLEERHCGDGSSKASDPPYKIEQGKIILEFPKCNVTTKPTIVKTTNVVKTNVVKPIVVTPEPKIVVPEVSKDSDVDTLVKMIEGARIESNNPKKAAKKARQKEKKEQERVKLTEEKTREEEMRKAEELRRLEELRKKEDEENQRREQEELKRLQDVERKQKEAADQKKEELTRKKQELERRKAEEKRLKKEAKKQRREQRKKDMDMIEEDDGTFNAVEDTLNSPAKTDARNIKKENDPQNLPPSEVTPADKEFGRIKHEKEQRKREEEEARRLEQLQAQERAQASKKNKKKKKKHKFPSENQESSLLQSDFHDNQEAKPQPISQPLLELLSNSGKESQRRNADDKSNLVTIKKHMDSSVTISMRGKEGENDLVYTLMNGQVYPTSVDGRIRTEDALPLQQTAFIKPETTRPNHNIINNDSLSFGNPVKCMGYSATPRITHESPAMTDIDLSQLKLPPGITITKVPQQLSGMRPDNGMHNSDSQTKSVHATMNEYHRVHPLSGMDSRCNSNIMVVDSRCSSLESPVIGIRPSDMMYGANGTRPSSEASVASDRPSSGLDSITINQGNSPFVGRANYPSSEVLNSRIPMPVSSPFIEASRNETPSPAWQYEMNPHHGGMPGMIPSNNVSRTDRHGYWSSTPASPVAFPPSSAVTESYLRAQDQQFIKSNPQMKGPYPHVGKRSSPAVPISDNGSAARKASEFKPPGGTTGFSTNASNGSKSPFKFDMLGYRPVIESGKVTPPSQWTPWNNHAERSSPEFHSVPPPMPYINPFVRANHHNGGQWEPTPCQEKPAARGVNPYGPIGSNITRRSGNITNSINSLSQNGKATENTRSGESSFWSFNPGF